MKLVSFDIGIKNMAYCVLDIQSVVRILDWNVINLSGDTSREMENSVAKCNCVLKKGSAVCGKKAQYFHIDTLKQQKMFCGTHAKSHSTLLLPKKEYELSQIKKKKVGDLAAWHQTVFGVSPGYMKKDDLIAALAEYYRTHCFTKVLEPVKVNAKDIDLINIGRAIKQQFDLVTAFSGADCIVIENQISTIATRMKTIQGMVAQYFIMREDTANANIVFVSSMNKLKGFVSKDNNSMDAVVDENYDHDTPEKSINPQYKQHKTDGMRITQGFMDANLDLGNWGDHFHKHKKRDDLADCFLQAIWYGSHHKLFTYADNLKINSV